MYVLPPGENGLVNATDALHCEATGKRPAASDDQLSQYADLPYGAPTLTNDKLTDYVNDESFGVNPEDVVRTETPGEGVTIYRDNPASPPRSGPATPRRKTGCSRWTCSATTARARCRPLRGWLLRPPRGDRCHCRRVR